MSTLARIKKPRRETRGRKPIPATLKKARCLIFAADEPLIDAASARAGLFRTRWLADRIRDGGRPLSELTQPQMEEA